MITTIDNDLLSMIDKLELSKRAQMLREEYFNCIPGVGSERATYSMESWMETEGEPLTIRRAKLVKKVLENIPVVIFPGQVLVGSETKYFRGSYPHLDYDGSYLDVLLEEQEGKVSLGGPTEKGCLTQEDLEKLSEAIKYWKGRTAAEKMREAAKDAFGEWSVKLNEAGVTDYAAFPQYPHVLDHEMVIERGLRSIIEEAKERAEKWREEGIDENIEKFYFWQAAEIVCEATIEFSRRYARQARQMAVTEKDPERRAELEKIADTCDWVPENPARNFQEAIQSVVLVHLAGKLESPCVPPAGYGLMDQYLYKFFKADMQEQRLTMEQAADFISDFYLYAARLEWIMEISWRDFMQKGCLTSIALGGQKANGEDASNELTYLFLHVMGLVKYAEPHLAMRVSNVNPQWLLRKAIWTNRVVGGGVPQFHNSDHMVNYMVKRGVSLESARNWWSYGCSQAVPADQGSTLLPSYINVPLLVDLTMHNGIASKTGHRLGVETGDPRDFKTFDELYAAFTRQADYITRKQMRRDRIEDTVRAAWYRQPLCSVLMPGCLEKGIDFASGGLNHYRIYIIKDRGHIPAADSLTAIKKLVYDENRFTMGELLEALDSNFADARGEQIRQICLSAPKYGNDNDEADRMVHDIGKLTGDIIHSQRNIFDGAPFAINRNGQAWHYTTGKKLGALPNGRKAGEPLADGSLSASQGMDRSGPTALLNSALKADFGQHAQGGILTIKLSAPLLQTQQLQDNVIALMNGFFDEGGTYVQFNILDAKVLREAQRNPEKYRDVVVRVGGYSAYFVHLSLEVQDEIIRRTEHAIA